MRAGYSVSGRHLLTLYRLCISMFPEDGLLHVYGVGEDEVAAFTHSASTALNQIGDDERAAGKAPKLISLDAIDFPAALTECLPLAGHGSLGSDQQSCCDPGAPMRDSN